MGRDVWPDYRGGCLLHPFGLGASSLGRLLQSERRRRSLVKPQFEVGKERVGKGGVVRDPLAHADAIAGVITAAEAEGWRSWCGGLTHHRTGGNHEYLLWLRAGAWGMQEKPRMPA